MTERLVPYNEFAPHVLAEELQLAVEASVELLETRNIHGPVKRYSANFDRAYRNVLKGQRETATGELGHFAIMSDVGDVIGSASVYPNLPLRKLHVPVPSGIARRIPFLSHSYPHATPNIHAWTRTGHEQELADAYSELADIAGRPSVHPLNGSPADTEPFTNAWTLEPKRSPQAIHEAITAASGLIKVATRRFDDGEDGSKVPPRGSLYVQVRSTHFTGWGAMSELKTGKHSLEGKIGQSEAARAGQKMATPQRGIRFPQSTDRPTSFAEQAQLHADGQERGHSELDPETRNRLTGAVLEMLTEDIQDK